MMHGPINIRFTVTIVIENTVFWFSEYDQQDATFLKFIYFCQTLYMFQTGFSVHHQQHKTAHTASGICQTNTDTCW